MKRKEAIKTLQELWRETNDSWYEEALDMAIEALQFVEHFDLLKEYQSLQEVVMCKDCRYANECHKSVQYTRNESNTVTIGFSQIEWCSKGERKEE